SKRDWSSDVCSSDLAVDPDKTSFLNILIDVLCLFSECDTVDKIRLLLPIFARKRSIDRKIECRHRYVVLTYSKFRVSSQPAYKYCSIYHLFDHPFSLFTASFTSSELSFV